MAERLVPDASAVIAMLRDETAATDVRRTIVSVLEGDGELMVPDHFWLELVNVLVRRYAWEPDEVVTAVRELDELGLRSVPVDRPLTLLALDRMVGRGLTAYDAAYLALAEAEDAALLTLDAGLAAAAGERAVVAGSRRTGEARVAYGSPAPAIAWAAHGRYLAELRRKAAGAT